MKQKVVRIGKIIIGVALLFLSFRGVNWKELFESFLAADLFWLLLTILSVIAGLALKAVRWAYLLKKFDVDVSFRRVAEAYFSGQAANIVLWVRGGEWIRLGLLTPGQSKKIAQIAATIALEKILDLLGLAGVAIWVIAYLPFEKALWARQWLLPVSGLAVIFLLFLIVFGQQVWRRVRKYIPGQSWTWVRRALRVLDRLVDNSLWMRDPWQVFPVLIYTIIIWLIMGGTNLLLFRSVNISAPAAAGGLVLVLIYIGLLPALMPGNIGPFYFFARTALEPFQVPLYQAVIFAMLLHAVVTLPSLIIGGLFLIFSGEESKQWLKKLLAHPQSLTMPNSNESL